MHRTSYLKIKYFKEKYLNQNENLNILDIGSLDKTGEYNYKLILNNKNWTYEGLDLIEGKNVDIVVKNLYNWIEINDETYDVIVYGHSFEHNEFFWITLNEIDRVLKPGGIICIIAPSSGPVNRNPYDCWRFTNEGMESLAKYIDFEILESGTNESDENPWHDSYVIAKKKKENLTNKLTEKMEELDVELNKILNSI